MTADGTMWISNIRKISSKKYNNFIVNYSIIRFLFLMIVEIEEPEEPTDELSTTLSTTSYSDFTQFIEDLG